jgi:hypothetical protein
MPRTVSVLLLSGLLLLAAPVSQAQDGALIERVISEQITAFQADDMEAAFALASPALRRLFRTSERFGQMVQQGYPMVHRPQSLRFLGRREVGGFVLQRVMVSDAEGRLHLLEYQMLQSGPGFVINGVRLIPAAGAGV